MIEIERSVGFLLAKAYQRACALFKEEFDGYDITPQQFGLLGFLWQQDGLSQAELSQRSQIDRTTMGGLIDRLEKEGLVKRIPHPEDRRAYRIVLTEKGRNLNDELSELAKKVIERFISRITPEEHITLLSILEKLRH
ncbi:MarR family winged helix-turn-helix transcriptional regulator [Geobacter sp. DSM 9736]|uniref:MarR family winged helix-turn-helix transcriptional regulator n=1 Tax=Geobacter sp. DSM 9736 TaxID=1277350 RepID=UPI000B5003BC|nr:MarR family transcriptional regulator [Geobacter sp. DSM 9736]SNB45851.1 DNA-binding transcriptional regulator, MarR family [Geobacter sp. DSM 9736]